MKITVQQLRRLVREAISDGDPVGRLLAALRSLEACSSELSAAVDACEMTGEAESLCRQGLAAVQAAQQYFSLASAER